MRNILFSAYFSFRPERLAFMSRLAAALPADVRPVLFNLAETVDTPIEVVNAGYGLKPRIDDPVATLGHYLNETFPEQAAEFMAHAWGEFEGEQRPFDLSAAGLLHRIQAFEASLDRYRPAAVFLWNQFNIFHRIAAALLARRGIRVGFFHDGLLPGSIAFDLDGEMGNSWIARHPDRFLTVPVSEADIQRAHAYLDGLDGTEISRRHVQRDGVNVDEALRLRGLDRRPVLFFAGQNDWHAGVKPANAETARHSPLFAGSSEAVGVLDAMAGELGFSLLYKPHPLCRDRFLYLKAEAFPNTLILASATLQACMAAASAVSTIASQTCYAAVLAGHPVMMFGRNQISGKNLTYDVDSLDSVGPAFERAILDPLAASRRDTLARHIAQLERSYLFDFGTTRQIFFRRGPDAAARMLVRFLDQPLDEMIALQAAGALD